MRSRFLLSGLILGICQFCFSQQAIDSIWSENQDSLEIATQSIQLGKGLRDTNLSLARNYNQQAVRIFGKLGKDSLKAVALAELGVTYSYLAKYSKAFEANFEAIDLATKFGDTVTLIDASNNIGIDYYYNDELDKAAAYFETVASLTRQLGDTLRLANSYNNLGLIAAEQRNAEQEATYYQKARKLMLAIDNLQGVALTSLNLSGVYRLLGQIDTARQLNEESIRLYTQLNNNTGLLDAYSMRYSLLLEEGDSSGAETLAKESLSIAVEGNFLQSQLHWLELLEQLYAAQQMHRKAYKLLSERNQLRDSLSEQGSEQKIAELEMRYQTAIKEQQIIQLELENQKAALALQEESQRRYILVVSLLFSLILGAFLIYQVRFRIRVNKILTAKNLQVSQSLAERETLLKEIHHRVKNNLQVISSLLRIQSRFIKDPNALEAIEQSRSRVKSMAMIHQRLHSNDTFENVNVPTFVEELVSEVSDSFDTGDRVSFDLSIENIELDLETMISISLILNETITNSLKYAFPGERAGTIWIAIGRKDADLAVEVRDDGIGFDQETRKQSFGTTLIRSFSEKLHGEYRLETALGVKHKLVIKDYFSPKDT